MRLLAILILTFSSFVSASTITFPGTGIQNSGGYKFLEWQGYRFETPNYGSLLLNNGGLWSGNAFGVTDPIRITRIDGGLFDLSGFNLTNHAAFACGGGFCGVDYIQVIGNNPGSFVNLFDSGYSSDTADYSVNPYLFSNLQYASIYAPDSFRINSINLSPASVPLPGAVWLFTIGLFALLFGKKHGTN